MLHGLDRLSYSLRLVGSAFFAMLLAIGGCKTMESTTSSEQARRLVDELYAAWSLPEPERIDEIFVDGGIYEDVAAGQVHRGKEAIKDLLRAAFAWSPDFDVTMTSVSIAGDTAMTEWVIEGTQEGPVGELPATGRTFRVRGASVISFREGKITEVRDYYDMASFLLQLGATIEPPGQQP